jgi:hypothetical protein
MQCAGVHLRPTPWPSFGCHTVGQLEKALSHIWHIVQFAKLHRDDRRLLQFGPESFPIPVDIAITTFSTAKTVAARQQRGHQEHSIYALFSSFGFCKKFRVDYVLSDGVAYLLLV